LQSSVSPFGSLEDMDNQQVYPKGQVTALLLRML